MQFKKGLIILLTLLMTIGLALPTSFAQDSWRPNNSSTDQWKMIDILVARPLGIVAGVLGTGIFLLALPYTLPTGGVDEAADTFIKRPFKFSFTRKCPDEDM